MRQAKEFFARRAHTIPAAMAAGLLVGALGDWPYGYYQVLRLVVCAAAIFVAYKSWTYRQPWGTWVFICIAVLFEPFGIWRIDREMWEVLDLVVAGLFLVGIGALHQPSAESRKALPAVPILLVCLGAALVVGFTWVVWPRKPQGVPPPGPTTESPAGRHPPGTSPGVVPPGGLVSPPSLPKGPERVYTTEEFLRMGPTVPEERWRYVGNWKRLREGMTEEEVLGILGLPTGRSPYPALDSINLWYSYYRVTISYRDRRVLGWDGPSE